jgi:hypothetical protein
MEECVRSQVTGLSALAIPYCKWELATACPPYQCPVSSAKRRGRIICIHILYMAITDIKVCTLSRNLDLSEARSKLATTFPFRVFIFFQIRR